ncbi:MAG: amidohydrolase family protein [Actinobacteria bacterium]|nr:amidohydrolase family protein [Actinomycetota bacterium]
MTQRIDADILIPGRGAPVGEATVVLDDGVVTYAGPRGDAPETPGAETTTAAAVMPGMWDCHGHFLGLRNADIAAIAREPIGVRAARAARDAEHALLAGFTSVREAGGLGVDLARVIDEGTIPGPTIYAPGAILSTTGGHGDLHDLPLDWVHDFGRRDGTLRLADGVDECVKAVREQLRRNAKVIKICASGGVLSEVDDPVHQQFTDQELRAMVEVAGMADRVVMAHCHGKPGIMAAIEAGCRSIEHGTFLDEEACDAMVETGTVLVPTRFIIHVLMAVGRDQGVPPSQMRKLEATAEAHASAVSMAHERGVTIALGTDIFMSGPALPVGWGRNGRELELLVDLGLTPLEAIETATANAPLTVGAQAPHVGVLEAGAVADVLTVAGDPLRDITLLGDPENVTGVWKAGVPVKG